VPSPTATAAPSPSPTVAPTPTATPAPPANLDPYRAQLVSGQYVSGANPLQEGETTRVQIVMGVSGPGNYGSTVVFDLGPSVSVVSATATRGMTMTAPGRVTWDSFALAMGESASVTIVADIRPGPGAAGGPVVIIGGSLTTAVAPGGGLVEVRGDPVTTAQIDGLANGGLVVARAGAAPVAPAAAPGAAAGAAAPGVGGGVAATTAAAPRPAAVTPTAVGRTGTGLVADTATSAVLLPAVALAVAGLLGLAIARRRRRA
jgi:hypothetical protein